ncbi:FHA domain-containing protein [Ruminococcus sp.]|uniref:FHA domain-containing protein n=1 Tax=Ruminococcus sp. TaxID=41978 RepID=UPI0025EE6C84|nr:FHA domain-containing protein [Ruminococcus sp.]
MESINLILCIIAAAALDICVLVILLTAYREKKSAKKKWSEISMDMELAEQGVIYELGCDEVLIGRHASADIRLPDLSVSRYHAILTISGDKWSIKDMDSKSGLFINGRMVKEAVLNENDIITLGNRRLIFRKRGREHVR